MLKQTLAHITCGHSNDRILARVIGRRPTKKLHADHSFFERFKITGDRPFHDVAEELSAAVAAVEGSSIDDLFEMLAERSDGTVGFGDSRDIRLASANGTQR